MKESVNGARKYDEVRENYPRENWYELGQQKKSHPRVPDGSERS